jgi:predicted esterase
MAIGGFSAGAFASAYAAYAMGQPAAAVIGLSAAWTSTTPSTTCTARAGLPPVLLFEGEHDLPSIPQRVGALASCAARAGLGVRHYVVPGKPHFYDARVGRRAEAVHLAGRRALRDGRRRDRAVPGPGAGCHPR